MAAEYSANNPVKVIAVSDESITFDDKSNLSSDHIQDCCEHHYLDFSQCSISDFEGLEFDLTSPAFFEKVEDYGIRLVPLNGHPVSIPGYGYNNGYYSANLTLILVRPESTVSFDITDCQSDITD